MFWGVGVARVGFRFLVRRVLFVGGETNEDRREGQHALLAKRAQRENLFQF